MDLRDLLRDCVVRGSGGPFLLAQGKRHRVPRASAFVISGYALRRSVGTAEFSALDSTHRHFGDRARRLLLACTRLVAVAVESERALLTQSGGADHLLSADARQHPAATAGRDAQPRVRMLADETRCGQFAIESKSEISRICGILRDGVGDFPLIELLRSITPSI